MRTPPTMSRLASLLAYLLLVLAAGPASAQQGAVPQHDLFPGYTATKATESFPGYTATPASEASPGYTAIPIGTTPLSESPWVFALESRNPAQMSAQDASLVSSLHPYLAKKAAFASFDLSDPGWGYRQILCPAFPDYLFLAFHHGPDPNGSSRFVAVLERNGAGVHIVSAYAHGMRPFESVWSKSGTYDVFNAILRRERGRTPLGKAPNWLVIGMCYAELSGSAVQVLTPVVHPGSSLDMLRLGANQAQLAINPDHSAQITFSDVSKPAVTTDWLLSFDPHGQLLSVAQTGERQAARIALKP